MAFTGSFVCSSFKVDLLCARHNFLLSGGHEFRAALYGTAAAFTAATAAYTATNELADATGGYSRPGNVLTRIDPAPASSPITTATTSFANTTWTSSTLTAYGAMVYNNTAAGKNACLILDFQGVKSSSAGDFTIQFPVNDGGNAIIRIA